MTQLESWKNKVKSAADDGVPDVLKEVEPVWDGLPFTDKQALVQVLLNKLYYIREFDT